MSLFSDIFTEVTFLQQNDVVTGYFYLLQYFPGTPSNSGGVPGKSNCFRLML